MVTTILELRSNADWLSYRGLLTRRVCNIFTDDEIKATIPSWHGCAAELDTVANDLKEYDSLRQRR